MKMKIDGVYTWDVFDYDPFSCLNDGNPVTTQAHNEAGSKLCTPCPYCGVETDPFYRIKGDKEWHFANKNKWKGRSPSEWEAHDLTVEDL